MTFRRVPAPTDGHDRYVRAIQFWADLVDLADQVHARHIGNPPDLLGPSPDDPYDRPGHPASDQGQDLVDEPLDGIGVGLVVEGGHEQHRRHVAPQFATVGVRPAGNIGPVANSHRVVTPRAFHIERRAHDDSVDLLSTPPLGGVPATFVDNVHCPGGRPAGSVASPLASPYDPGWKRGACRRRRRIDRFVQVVEVHDRMRMREQVAQSSPMCQARSTRPDRAPGPTPRPLGGPRSSPRRTCIGGGWSERTTRTASTPCS